MNTEYEAWLAKQKTPVAYVEATALIISLIMFVSILLWTLAK